MYRSVHENQVSPNHSTPSTDKGREKTNANSEHRNRIGPEPGFVQVSRRFWDNDEIQTRLKKLEVDEGEEIAGRLNSVTWIEEVRTQLHMPVETFNTAVIWLYRFRLTYPPKDYDYRDASAAALFVAGKIEDTLKKSKEILCTAHNLKLPAESHRSPDDAVFEQHSKIIIGLERLMLEANSFDFRTSHPNMFLVKLCKKANLEKNVVSKDAFDSCFDIYRTYAPIKHTRQTVALACIEFACRLHDIDMSDVAAKARGLKAEEFQSTRQSVLEALMDLLDLYIQHRNWTRVGPKYPDQKYLDMLIALNEECKQGGYTRNESLAGERDSDDEAEVPGLPDFPLGMRERGRDGTVRFMLDAQSAKEERKVVKKYFNPETVIEYVDDDEE